MQFLVFHLGKDRYGLSTRQLLRVLPLMALKHLPQAPDYVAGLMNYHGAPVPVIDLGMLACAASCSAHFDTRILLTDFCAGDGTRHLLGLIVERVIHLDDIDCGLFSDSGVSNPDARYLGKVVARGGALLQLIELEHVLPAEVCALLFQPTSPVAPC